MMFGKTFYSDIDNVIFAQNKLQLYWIIKLINSNTNHNSIV